MGGAGFQGCALPLCPPPSTDCSAANVSRPAGRRARLPKDICKRLQKTLDAGEPLDPSLADAVAAAMKDWALEKGATHYTHWFQPLTGLTAEKHDSFYNPDRKSTRLNSSHANISYAVFCLKKKN